MYTYDSWTFGDDLGFTRVYDIATNVDEATTCSDATFYDDTTFHVNATIDQAVVCRLADWSSLSVMMYSYTRRQKAS